MNLQGRVNKLFTEGHWEYNGCLNFSADPDYGYAEGYKRASDILISWIKNQRRDQDFLVYPIIFLYRQSIELKLKSVIKNGLILLEINSEKIDHHNIVKLFDKSREILLKVGPMCHEDLIKLEKIILALNELDPSSYVWRYSKDKKGNATLNPEDKSINLATLSEEITKAYSFLDGACLAIAHLSQEKLEFLYEQQG